MSRSSLKLLLPIALISSVGLAFDPFSVMAVVSTGASIISSVSDGASELAGAADAMSEVYSEVDPEAEVSQGAKRLVEKMREVQALAQEVGETKDAVDSLLQHDRAQAKSLTAVLKKLTQAVRTAKRLGRLLSKLEKKAQMAQIESVELEREQLRVQYKLLEQQISSELDKKKATLQELASKRQQMATHLAEMRAKGAKAFGRSGVFSFPKSDIVVQKAVELAKKVRPLLVGLIALAFFLRLVFYQVSISGSHRYGDLVRDVIVCGFLLAAFPQIVDGCIGVSSFLAKAIVGSSLQDLTEAPAQPAGSFILNWDQYVLWIASWVRFGVYCITEFLFSFGIAFLIFLFPIVIFASSMLNLTMAWPVFLSSFCLLTLWPFFWNAIGVFASTLPLADSLTIADQLKILLFSLLQLVSPFVAISVLRGSSLKQSTVSAARSAHAAATKSWQGGQTAARGTAAAAAFTGATAVSSAKHVSEAAYRNSGRALLLAHTAAPSLPFGSLTSRNPRQSTNAFHEARRRFSRPAYAIVQTASGDTPSSSAKEASRSVHKQPAGSKPATPQAPVPRGRQI
jgi:hypothetical protein